MMMLWSAKLALFSVFATMSLVESAVSKRSGEGNTTLVIDRSKQTLTFDGIGGLSGGGATSRLLVDYPAEKQSEILDYLFKPNFGAAVQILKVEMGGDAQSTDGVEPSHMHAPDDLSFERGYEWWLMVEAKRRNPAIKLYTLPWAFPGWVGQGSGSPYTHPELTAGYVVRWIEGARDRYGLHIDYVGVWNERPSNGTYVKLLRRTLDARGLQRTQIVCNDGFADICETLSKDKEYAAAVDIIGLHYPSDYPTGSDARKRQACLELGKPVWASEESSSYDDLNGAACWARVMVSHAVLSSFTASIIWNLLGAYMEGTNWFGSSLMNAVEPWSGNYQLMPVLWATAHVTQFTEIGWRYLAVGEGSGELPAGGFYTTLVDPANPARFTLHVVKVGRDHASCTRPSLPSFNVTAETVTFRLGAAGEPVRRLAVWYSNFEDFSAKAAEPFRRLADIVPDAQGQFVLTVPVGAFYTVSTITDGPSHGSHGVPPTRSPAFPLPYTDNFDDPSRRYAVGQEARYFTDQVGAFEVHEETAAAAAGSTGRLVMRQMVPDEPVAWTEVKGVPVSLIGMREWQDVRVRVSVRMPACGVAGCVGVRVDQDFAGGFALCVYACTNTWAVSTGGPARSRAPGPKGVVASGQVPRGGVVAAGEWAELSFAVVDDRITEGTFNGTALFNGTLAVRSLDFGFAAIATNGWYEVAFGNVTLEQVGPRWAAPLSAPASSPRAGAVGAPLCARPCTTNGLTSAADEWELLPGFSIRNVASQLCATVSEGGRPGAGLELSVCSELQAVRGHQVSPAQQFRNDYTRVRNEVVSFTAAEGGLLLTGNTDGQLTVAAAAAAPAAAAAAAAVPSFAEGAAAAAAVWQKWAFFPSTGQLRNQYVADLHLGYPMCLSTC